MIEVLTGFVIGFTAAMTTIGLNAGNKILEMVSCIKPWRLKREMPGIGKQRPWNEAMNLTISEKWLNTGGPNV